MQSPAARESQSGNTAMRSVDQFDEVEPKTLPSLPFSLPWNHTPPKLSM